MLSPVKIGTGDRLLAGIPPRYVTGRLRQLRPGALNRVRAVIGWGSGRKSRNVTFAEWQVTLCDTKHVSSRRLADRCYIQSFTLLF